MTTPKPTPDEPAKERHMSDPTFPPDFTVLVPVRQRFGPDEPAVKISKASLTLSLRMYQSIGRPAFITLATGPNNTLAIAASSTGRKVSPQRQITVRFLPPGKYPAVIRDGIAYVALPPRSQPDE